MSKNISIYAKYCNIMKRYAINKLIDWKESQNRKPLIIRGARQVGKTWLMKEFGKTQYKKTIYINFEDNDLMREHTIAHKGCQFQKAAILDQFFCGHNSGSCSPASFP